MDFFEIFSLFEILDFVGNFKEKILNLNQNFQVTGGRNGFGAKLCNIFSVKFTVETVHKKKKFRMTWTGNMQQKKAAQIGSSSNEDYTKITFRPDLTRFKVDCLSDDMVGLFRKRAYDVAGTTAGLKVFLDGKKISFSAKNPFKDYCEMYTKDRFFFHFHGK